MSNDSPKALYIYKRIKPHIKPAKHKYIYIFLFLFIINPEPITQPRIHKIGSFIDPNTGNNYQPERASEAIINGGFFGRGLGEGKLNSKIPEAHTDYIS